MPTSQPVSPLRSQCPKWIVQFFRDNIPMLLVRLAVIAALPCLLTAKAPITHEDVWLMKRVDAPIRSPDGKWAVFSVTEPSYNPAELLRDLWMVPTDGSQPARRLTNTKGPRAARLWSPDSKRIVFSAKREGDEAAQIYVLDISQPGEAVRITSLSTGASSPVFSPDGRMFSSSPAFIRERRMMTRIGRSQPSERLGNTTLAFMRASRFAIGTNGSTRRSAMSLYNPLEPGAAARDLAGGHKARLDSGIRGSVHGLSPGSLCRLGSGRQIDRLYGDRYAQSERIRKRKDGSLSDRCRRRRAEADHHRRTQLQQACISSRRQSALLSLRAATDQTIYSLERLAMFDWPADGRP